VRRDVIVLVHGGPVATPEDAEFILENTRELPRLLRRVLDGAPADRGGAHGADPHVQADQTEDSSPARRPRGARLGGRDSHDRSAHRPAHSLAHRRVIVIAVVYWVMTWLYRRSTKEIAFVRTGFLGEKVVIDGGAFVWPIVHDITPVNMNTLPLRSPAQQGRGADHQGPHARRRRGRVLRPRSPDPRGGLHRRRHLGRRTLEPRTCIRCWPASSSPRCARSPPK
jgi:hypothetical protein